MTWFIMLIKCVKTSAQANFKTEAKSDISKISNDLQNTTANLQSLETNSSDDLKISVTDLENENIENIQPPINPSQNMNLACDEPTEISIGCDNEQQTSLQSTTESAKNEEEIKKIEERLFELYQNLIFIKNVTRGNNKHADRKCEELAEEYGELYAKFEMLKEKQKALELIDGAALQ